MTHLSVVIPVLNEVALIEELINRVKLNVKKITSDFEIIIVDDGSKDGTWQKIKTAGESLYSIKEKQKERQVGFNTRRMETSFLKNVLTKRKEKV